MRMCFGAKFTETYVSDVILFESSTELTIILLRQDEYYPHNFVGQTPCKRITCILEVRIIIAILWGKPMPQKSYPRSSNYHCNFVGQTIAA